MLIIIYIYILAELIFEIHLFSFQNFYLIDPQLIAFCGLVLVRRVIWTIEKKVKVMLPVKGVIRFVRLFAIMAYIIIR